MRLILNIQVLTGMPVQQFVLQAEPGTLRIEPSQFGIGNRITVADASGFRREWYAYRIMSAYFDEITHTDTCNDGKPTALGWRAYCTLPFDHPAGIHHASADFHWLDADDLATPIDRNKPVNIG